MMDIDNIDSEKLQELAQWLYEQDGHAGNLYKSMNDLEYENKALDYIEENELEKEYTDRTEEAENIGDIKYDEQREDNEM